MVNRDLWEQLDGRSYSLPSTVSLPLSQLTSPPKEEQIASGVLAAPKERRAVATVLGNNAKGDWSLFARAPTAKGISVACYHKDLESLGPRPRVERPKQRQ